MAKNKKEMKQSETIIIKRSQINFAPYNPKRHSKEAIAKQKKNFENIGFLGGVVWNALTGNLVSGHKRIMAMDLYYGYDGTPATDYDVKVERVELTDKQEKEQNVFMDAKGTNTAQDFDLLAELLPDIDYKLAGLDESDLNLIAVESPVFDTVIPKQTIQADFSDLKKDQEAKKQAIIQAKKEIKQRSQFQKGETYVTLTFTSYENKCEFMERFGFDNDALFIEGEMFADMVERAE